VGRPPTRSLPGVPATKSVLGPACTTFGGLPSGASFSSTHMPLPAARRTAVRPGDGEQKPCAQLHRGSGTSTARPQRAAWRNCVCPLCAQPRAVPRRTRLLAGRPGGAARGPVELAPAVLGGVEAERAHDLAAARAAAAPESAVVVVLALRTAHPSSA